MFDADGHPAAPLLLQPQQVMRFYETFYRVNSAILLSISWRRVQGAVRGTHSKVLFHLGCLSSILSVCEAGDRGEEEASHAMYRPQKAQIQARLSPRQQPSSARNSPTTQSKAERAEGRA